MPPDTFKDDVILVTGGGTGLGKAMAQMFSRHGGRIAIASRKEEHRAAGAAAIEALGGTAIGGALGIRDPAQVTRAFTEIEGTISPVTSLISHDARPLLAHGDDNTANGWGAGTQTPKRE